MPLTDVKCRNAKGKIKPHKLSDGGGLHLLVNADGAKYWRLAYRWHGKQRTLALGVYPAVGLVEARAARDDAKRSLAANVDPSIVKRESLAILSKRSHANGTKTGEALGRATTRAKSSGVWRQMSSQRLGGVRLPNSNQQNCSICCARLRSAG